MITEDDVMHLLDLQTSLWRSVSAFVGNDVRHLNHRQHPHNFAHHARRIPLSALQLHANVSAALRYVSVRMTVNFGFRCKCGYHVLRQTLLGNMINIVPMHQCHRWVTQLFFEYDATHCLCLRLHLHHFPSCFLATTLIIAVLCKHTGLVLHHVYRGDVKTLQMLETTLFVGHMLYCPREKLQIHILQQPWYLVITPGAFWSSLLVSRNTSSLVGERCSLHAISTNAAKSLRNRTFTDKDLFLTYAATPLMSVDVLHTTVPLRHGMKGHATQQKSLGKTDHSTRI